MPEIPQALEIVAGAMAATLMPTQDAAILDEECRDLAAHVDAADSAAARFAGEVAAMRQAVPGLLGVSLPPDVGHLIRAEAARLGEDAAPLAIEVLRAVFTRDERGGDLVSAVLNRDPR